MPIEQLGEFKVASLQVLDEKGGLDKELEPELTDSSLVELYRAMCLAREVDQRMLKLQRQGRMGVFPLSTGQEAATCGAVFALEERDWFVSGYRDIGGRFLRGEPVVNCLLSWNGWEEGNSYPGNDRTLPLAIVVGSQIPHAVGIAYAMRLKGEKETCVLACFGDGASSQGDFHEALNFAAVWQVNVVFLCQNNQYAISTPVAKQTKSRTIAQKAIAYDMPGIQVDGNDALAVYKATKEALDRARAGGGPTLIEAVTYRLEMHTTADDPKKYRSDEEVEYWKKRDPLTRFRIYLGNKGIWDDKKQADLEKEIKDEVDSAVNEFESMDGFKPDAPFDFIYGTTVAQIEEQRADFLENVRLDNSNG